jgi:NAD(P)-dependent dehydrogenase (short-subunit alcohol dehydrogenase family)
MDIKDRIAIVTGAAAGIGRATAVMLAQHGARGIALADVDGDGLAQTAKLVESHGASVLTVDVDVTSTAALENLYDSTEREFGGIDIVFNNAGIVSGPPGYRVPQAPQQPIFTA